LTVIQEKEEEDKGKSVIKYGSIRLTRRSEQVESINHAENYDRSSRYASNFKKFPEYVYYTEISNLISMKYDVFWDVMPCGLCKNRRFGRAYGLHHQVEKNH
jgi:hypothetical protein